MKYNIKFLENSLICKRAFSFIELIIAMLVLTVLWIISLISYFSYVSIVRDSSKLVELDNIESSLFAYNMISWLYPEPSNGVNITYSWAIVWTQWTFWFTVSNIIWYSKGTIDPYTGNEYTYSVKNSRNEFSLAWVLEEHWSFLSRYNAYWITNAEEIWKKTWFAVVKWNYNWEVISISLNSVTNILALPSIISTDLSSLDLLNILDNNRLVYNNYTNLPASYYGSIYNLSSNINLASNNLIVYSWSISDLKNSYNQVLLLKDIYLSYSWSILWNTIPVSKLNKIDLFSENPSNNIKAYAYNFIYYKLKYLLE